MKNENALFNCLNCEADLGPTGQQHLENTEDGGQIWNCEPVKRGSLRMESFDQAHRGRCPACTMFDNGTHTTHRYGYIEMKRNRDGDSYYLNSSGKLLKDEALESRRRAGFAFMRRELGLKEKAA